MTAQEAEEQRLLLQMLAQMAAEKSKEFYIDGQEFTLSEIARKCEVYRYNENYGEVDCSGSKFRVIERKCEAFFPDDEGEYGELDCRGSELSIVERSCSVDMYSDSYGDIDC
jgi:hypothetical protein